MVRININIDRLVLEGFDYHDHLRISRAMEQELSRLVSENNLLPATDLTMIDAGTLSIKGNMNPQVVGAEIAQSVYRSLVDKK